MSTYTQLTQEERYQIYALMKAGHTLTEVAELLGRHKSTISRELKRNHGLRGYRPKQAQELAHGRRQKAHRHRISASHWNRAEELLRQDWSPEQVSGWLRREEGITISHEWIYLYIYADKRDGGDLHQHLRCQKQRRKRYGSYERRGQLKDRVCIDERPAVVDQRSRIGDWEADTVIGKPGGAVLVTLAERKTRQSILVLSPDKSAKAVKKAIIGALKPHAAHVHTITYDNGKEFACHKEIASALDARGYFAHPYHSWERGLNENMNGLVRQYLPKGKCFDSLTAKDIQHIMDKLNNRPRKCLGYKTPNQVFLEINPPVALVS
jgi:transposase, IS30 family